MNYILRLTKTEYLMQDRFYFVWSFIFQNDIHIHNYVAEASTTYQTAKSRLLLLNLFDDRGGLFVTDLKNLNRCIFSCPYLNHIQT